jgi:Tfp pilus assembly protein FimT
MKGWTLIELIFIILIVGILSIIGMNSISDNTLLNNTNFLYNKILEKKANAIGFEANMNNNEENRSVCITFTNDWIKNDENYSNVKFNLSNRVSINSTVKTVCFDYLGRAYNGAVNLDTLDNLLHDEVNVTLKSSVNNKERRIIIFPITGHVEQK